METQELEVYEREADREARSWIAEAERITIETADDAQAAADWLNEDITPRRKAVEDFFEPLVSAAHKAHKALTQRRASILEQFEQPERIVKAKLTAWKQAEDERQAAAVKEAGAASLLVIAEPEHVNGVAFVQTWKAEVEDLGALIKAAAEHEHLRPLLLPNVKALAAMAKALGGALNVPGVRVFQDSSVRRTG